MGLGGIWAPVSGGEGGGDRISREDPVCERRGFFESVLNDGGEDLCSHLLSGPVFARDEAEEDSVGIGGGWMLVTLDVEDPGPQGVFLQ